jgi:uncharacterized membrane protein YphA (DoxX/SURF4 family)
MHAQSIGRPAAVSTLGVGLWIVQVVLAGMFAFAGVFHFFTPVDALNEMMGLSLPGILLRFVGLSEMLGALGLILPGLLRIRPILTPIAAACLALLMVGAAMFTPPEALAMASIPLGLGLLAALVAYGRWRLAPHQRRASH